MIKYYMMNICELMEKARTNEEVKSVFLKRWDNCDTKISGEFALSDSPNAVMKMWHIIEDVKRRDDQFRINALRAEARSSEEARTALEKLCARSNIGVPISELIEMSTPIFDTTILPSMSI